MKKFKPYILLLSILLSIFTGCEKWTDQEQYKRPDWLPGKLYSAVSVQEDLTMFAECLRLAKLDTILNVSGVWSVFAPTDEAMRQYLAENQYANISDIPLDELNRIAEFHIIQNPWTLEQLQILGSSGWREGDNHNSNSYAFKRQTMFKNPVQKYWIKRTRVGDKIVVDSTLSDGYKSVIVDSRKYVPIFYDEYFEVNDLTSDDYSFYFDRPYEPGNVFYAGAKVLQADIFAENGFIHIIDKVVNPMLNAKEFLEREIPGESYKLFLELVNWYYPTLEANMTATFNQPSVRQGGLIDTLWDLNYPDLNFDLHHEIVGIKGSNYNETLVKHNGLFVPTDDAFKQFIDGILTVKSGFPHWPDHKSLPVDLVEIIVNQHFKTAAMYPSTNTYRTVFKNEGRFYQSEDDIIRKEFGSNCTLIGIDSYIPDRVFTSVTGPVFLRPHYTTFRLALEYTGVDDVIANHQGELYFFPIPDYVLEEDQSLLINWIDRAENRYNFRAYHRDMLQMVGINRGTLRTMLLNHVGTRISGSSTGIETFRTLRGNTITWNHTNNTIRGPRPSTIGYGGWTVGINNPVPLEEPADNGKAWSIKYWFQF